MKGRNWNSTNSVSEFPSDPDPKDSNKWISLTVAIIIILAAIIFVITKL